MKKNDYYGYVYRARKVANNSSEIPARIADMFVFNGTSVVDITQILNKPTEEKIFVSLRLNKKQFEIVDQIEESEVPEEILKKFKVRIGALNLIG